MSISKKNSFILITIVFCLVLVLSISLVACNDDKEPTVAKPTTFVAIDINPSIEMVLDQNNIVLSVSAANSDAEVLLWKEDGIVGANATVAMSRIGTLAVKLGYVTNANNNINVTVSAPNSIDSDKIYATVSKSLASTINSLDNAIKATTNNAIDIVLSKELEKVNAINTGKKGYGETLTLARYRLVKRAMAADRSLKRDDAVKMSNEDLVAKVESAQADAKVKYGAAYQLAVKEAQFAYESAKQIAIDTTYYTYFLASENRNLAKLNNSRNYLKYKTTYTYLEHYYNFLRDYLDNPIYTFSDAQAIYNAISTYLGGANYETFKAEITDENGNVTGQSIKSYLNKIYRNLSQDKQESFAKAYDNIQTVLDNISFSGFENILSKDIPSNLINDIHDVSIDYENAISVESAITNLKEKADKSYAAMNLTEEEKADILSAQNELSKTISEYESKFKKAISAAQAKAEETLNALKAEKLASTQGQTD